MNIKLSSIVRFLQAQDNRIEDGTYVVRPSFVGSAASFYVERVELNEGFEVGVEPFGLDGRELAYGGHGDSIRLGIWADGDGIIHIDVVVHVDNLSMAHQLGKQFNQTHIWSWKRGAALPVR